MSALGSQQVVDLNIHIGRQVVPAKVRANLFGSDLGVVLGPELYQGMILVPRWEELARLLGNQCDRRLYKWRPDALRFYTVGSIYRAIRQQLHILSQYGLHLSYGEKGMIQRARQAALRANAAALGIRTRNIRSRSQTLVRLAGPVIEELGEPRDLDKREGQQFLTDILSARDSRGRPNETVAMVKALVASHRFRQRLEEGIMRVEPIVVMRQKVLVGLSLLSEYQIEVALDLVTRALKLSNLALEQRRQKGRHDLAQRLQTLALELIRYDFRPFVRPFNLTASEFQAAAQFFMVGNWPSFWRVLLVSRESLKLQRLRIELERLIYLLTEAQLSMIPAPPWPKLIQRGSALKRGFVAVDDQRFQIPVRSKVLEYLNLANQALRQRTLGGIGQAREHLKQASEVLDG